MRHGKKVAKLSRKSAHRKAMLGNMASSLITSPHKRIETTVPKAKALRKYIEPLLTRSKTDNTHNRRMVFRYLQDKDAVKTLFNEVSKKVADRNGGYTRIIKLGYRLGDNAETAMIELVDYNNLMLEEQKSSGGRRRRRRRKKSSSNSSSNADQQETTTATEDAGEGKEDSANEAQAATAAEVSEQTATPESSETQAEEEANVEATPTSEETSEQTTSAAEDDQADAQQSDETGNKEDNNADPEEDKDKNE